MRSAVIPTTGKTSLSDVIEGLSTKETGPQQIVLVDVRLDQSVPLVEAPSPLTSIISAPGASNSAARNAGWKKCTGEWVVFLDDDVIPSATWPLALERDLANASPGVGGVQGRIEVPLPSERRPTDWERSLASVEDVMWAAGDIAYRISALESVNGFGERLRANHREAADLAIRMQAENWRIVLGRRRSTQTIRQPDGFIDVLGRQVECEDDLLMRVLHGRNWREDAGVSAGRGPIYVVAAAAGVMAVVLPKQRRLGAFAAGIFGAVVGEHAWTRIDRGPRTRSEITTVVASSVLAPFAVTATYLKALVELPTRFVDPPSSDKVIDLRIDVDDVQHVEAEPVPVAKRGSSKPVTS